MGDPLQGWSEAQGALQLNAERGKGRRPPKEAGRRPQGDREGKRRRRAAQQQRCQVQALRGSGNAAAEAAGSRAHREYFNTCNCGGFLKESF